MDSAYHFFKSDQKELVRSQGKDSLLEAYEWMLLIRNFEVRAESAYLQGKIGGFFHAYTGQEAIQTAAVQAVGKDNWWSASYRCHALALLLGATTDEVMAEFYGRETGNAQGRGGSMHLYTDRLLGGSGIVGGQIPLGTGAAFALKYKNIKDQASFCFLGDGAVAQGTFHESLNIASLWDLPVIYVIENNHWGMGTGEARAICSHPIAETQAPGYKMKSYTLDGMDYFNCYAGFKHIYEEVLETQRPVLVECVTERFKGHSISDPGLYRSKDELKHCMERDPIKLLKDVLIENKMITEEQSKELDKKCREKVVASMKFADDSPWPSLSVLEEDVMAP